MHVEHTADMGAVNRTSSLIRAKIPNLVEEARKKEDGKDEVAQ